MSSQDATAGGFAQLMELVAAVRRRWRLVAAIVLAAGLAAYALTATRTKQYEATSEVFISQTDPVSSVLSGVSSRPADPERDFNTRVALIAQPNVAARVDRRLRLSLGIDGLLGKVATGSKPTSDIATITARDPSPERAVAIANAFATEYVASRQRAVQQRVQQAVTRGQRRLDAMSATDRASPMGAELADRLRQLRVDAALQSPGVEVVSFARRPAAPSSPRPKLASVVAMFFAGLVGVALAVGLELRDRRLRDESDLDPFDVPLLGAIPRMPPGPGPGPDDVAGREALAAVAGSLRFLHDRRAIRAVLLTAADRRDAQAAVPLGLTVALAEAGLRVITIEADLRRPRFAELLDAPASTGLSGVLAGDGHVDDVLLTLATGGGPCGVVPAGTAVVHPAGMLAGPAMAAAVARARDLADLVLISAPPLGAVGDALTLARLADGTVLLAPQGDTRLDGLAAALRALARVPATLLGVVLTNLPRPRREAGYGETRARRTGRLAAS